MRLNKRDFLILEGTPVYLDGRQLLSTGDFVVSFSGDVLREIEGIKSGVRRIGGENFFFPVSTEHGSIHVSVEHMHSMH
ncbi:hypothetical protein HUU51_01735 [Candidatus Gracilibacteria bacterium]|nr:hypothetical protein [Candidatus Gracilibacteria bacterium]